ncbi:MAG: FixH family protein [Magnetococcales bacterium]|nr:FixH family protein [Magnetococcales bacterium]
MRNSTSDATATRRRWLAAGLGLLVTVLGANATLIVLSSQTWNGLITDRPFEKGLAFNRVLQAQRDQDVLGWRGTLDSATLTAGTDHPLIFRLLDAAGQPVTGARVTGTLFRVVHQGHDRTLTLAETAPGHYSAHLVVPLPGVWDVKLVAVRDSAEFRFVRRIQVPPGGQS